VEDDSIETRLSSYGKRNSGGECFRQLQHDATYQSTIFRKHPGTPLLQQTAGRQRGELEEQNRVRRLSWLASSISAVDRRVQRNQFWGYTNWTAGLPALMVTRVDGVNTELRDENISGDEEISRVRSVTVTDS